MPRRPGRPPALLFGEELTLAALRLAVRVALRTWNVDLDRLEWLFKRAYLEELREEGLPLPDIADLAGRSPSKMGRWSRDILYPPRPKGPAGEPRAGLPSEEFSPASRRILEMLRERPHHRWELLLRLHEEGCTEDVVQIIPLLARLDLLRVDARTGLVELARPLRGDDLARPLSAVANDWRVELALMRALRPTRNTPRGHTLSELQDTPDLAPLGATELTRALRRLEAAGAVRHRLWQGESEPRYRHGEVGVAMSPLDPLALWQVSHLEHLDHERLYFDEVLRRPSPPYVVQKNITAEMEATELEELGKGIGGLVAAARDKARAAPDSVPSEDAVITWVMVRRPRS